MHGKWRIWHGLSRDWFDASQTLQTHLLSRLRLLQWSPAALKMKPEIHAPRPAWTRPASIIGCTWGKWPVFLNTWGTRNSMLQKRGASRMLRCLLRWGWWLTGKPWTVQLLVVRSDFTSVRSQSALLLNNYWD